MTPTPDTDQVRLDRLRRYVHVLDDGIRIPGTRFRIGLDPVLGLVPGAGDFAGALLSVAIIWEGARRGISRLTLLRMAVYVAIDMGLGSVPLAGDAFDAVFKVNRFNLALLERELGHEVTRPPGGVPVGVILVALAVVCVSVAAAVTYIALLLVGVVGG